MPARPVYLVIGIDPQFYQHTDVGPMWNSRRALARLATLPSDADRLVAVGGPNPHIVGARPGFVAMKAAIDTFRDTLVARPNARGELYFFGAVVRDGAGAPWLRPLGVEVTDFAHMIPLQRLFASLQAQAPSRFTLVVPGAAHPAPPPDDTDDPAGGDQWETGTDGFRIFDLLPGGGGAAIGSMIATVKDLSNTVFVANREYWHWNTGNWPENFQVVVRSNQALSALTGRNNAAFWTAWSHGPIGYGTYTLPSDLSAATLYQASRGPVGGTFVTQNLFIYRSLTGLDWYAASTVITADGYLALGTSEVLKFSRLTAAPVGASGLYYYHGQPF